MAPYVGPVHCKIYSTQKGHFCIILLLEEDVSRTRDNRRPTGHKGCVCSCKHESVKFNVCLRFNYKQTRTENSYASSF